MRHIVVPLLISLAWTGVQRPVRTVLDNPGTGLTVLQNPAGNAEFVIAAGPFESRRLLRLDAQTGEVKWRITTPSPSWGGPRVVGAVAVAIGERGHSAFGVDIEDGHLRWVTDAAKAAWRDGVERSFSLESDGRLLYLPTAFNHGVAALEPLDGTVVWSHYDPYEGTDPFPRFVVTLLPVGGRLLTDYGWLDAATGRPIQSFTGEPRGFTAVSDDASAAFTSTEHEFRRVDPATLSIAWRCDFTPYGEIAAAADDRAVAVVARKAETNRVPDSGGGNLLSLVALHDTETGKRIWTRQLSLSRESKPVLDEDCVYVFQNPAPPAKDRVIALDRRTGLTKWAYVVEPGTVSLTSVGSSVFLRAGDAIHNLDRRTGRLRWRSEVR